MCSRSVLSKCYALSEVKKGFVTIFSVTLKSQNTSLYQWKPKNNGPVLLKIILLVL